MILKKKLVALFLALSFLGFVDSSFLTAKHYQDSPVTCLVFTDCDKVLTSPYATVGHLPVSLLGSIFYLTVFLLAVFYLDTQNSRVLPLLFGLSLLGFLMSLWFAYLQLFVIKSICPYCLLSAAISMGLFALAAILKRRYGKVLTDSGFSESLKRRFPETISK